MASYSEKMRIHGILMLLGWGFFLPVGIFVRAHSKKSWNHEVFGVHFHMVMGTIGMILALAGFGYAVKNFSALEQVRMEMLVLFVFPFFRSSCHSSDLLITSAIFFCTCHNRKELAIGLIHMSMPMPWSERLPLLV